MMVNFEIERLVPKFLLADRNGRAMAKAIEAGLEILTEKFEDAVKLLNDPDSMPGWRCDECAWEMGALWYDSTASLDEKRAQVKSIASVYSTLGTKDGIMSAVTSLFGGSGYVNAWYEYSGSAYHYKVFVTSDNVVSERNAECRRLLDILSGESTVLDAIQYVGSTGTTGTTYTATGCSGAYSFAKGVAV